MLKDDVKSLNQLLPVIRDIADNETDEIILNYYEEIMYSTNRSIVALNNLVSTPTLILLIFIIITLYSLLQIAALEKNNGGEEAGNDGNVTEVYPTDNTVSGNKLAHTCTHVQTQSQGHTELYIIASLNP